MSRTTKDTPYWVRAEWYKPDHQCWQGTQYPYLHCRYRRECDLPAKPVRHRFYKYPDQPTMCTWEPVWDWKERRVNGVPSWFVAHTWHNPQRVLMRSQLTRARKEWNGSGDTDVDVANYQHRNQARWLYW